MKESATAGQNKRQPSRQQGSVLVAVLAVILLLSFIITRFMNEAVEDLEYRAIFNETNDIRTFAFSMLEASLATVQEVALIDEGKLYAPEQGWSDPIRYTNISVPSGWDVQIELSDVSGKLPLNSMSEKLLNNLLEEQLDFDFGTARELSSSLLDWIDADDDRRLNGAESETYLDRSPSYRSSNRPILNLHELKLLQTWDEEFFDENGQPKPVFNQFSQLVSTIYTGPINLNAAPAAVIELLALQDGFQDQSVFDGLDTPYLKTAPAGANLQTCGTEVRLLQITVTIQRGNSPYIITALVEPQIRNSSQAIDQNVPSQKTRNSNLIKTGTFKEQAALKYPFKFLQISEYDSKKIISNSARHSALDIKN